MQINVMTTINAPPDHAFDCVADRDAILEWSEDVQQITPGEPWNPDDPVGSRFTQTIREGGRTATYDGEILAYDKPRHLAMRLSSAQFTMRIDYRFSPIATQAGWTRLDYTVGMTMHSLLARIMGRLFIGFTRRLARRQVEALKVYAERTC